MDIFFFILVILFGLSVGSFLNVVVLRFDDMESVIKGRSQCPKCKKILAWYELIPFFSYLFLAGKCRGCKKTISIQYPLVEVATGVLFFLTYFYYGFSFDSLFLAIIFSLLVVIATYDILHKEIPDVLTYLAILFAAGFIAFKFASSGGTADIASWANYGYGLIIGGGFFAFLVVISGQKWMGAGDVLLGIFMGIFLGFPNIVLALFVAFLAGAIAGLFMMGFGKKKLKDAVPFAPFLVLATVIAVFWGERILNSYFRIYW